MPVASRPAGNPVNKRLDFPGLTDINTQAGKLYDQADYGRSWAQIRIHQADFPDIEVRIQISERSTEFFDFPCGTVDFESGKTIAELFESEEYAALIPLRDQGFLEMDILSTHEM